MNWFLLFKVYWIWPCLTKPCEWLFPNPKHRQNTLGSIQRSPPSKCLQEMRNQVKDDLVFSHTRSFYWIFIQDKVKSWPKDILKYLGSFVWTRMSIFFYLIMIAFVVQAFHIEHCFHVVLWKKSWSFTLISNKDAWVDGESYGASVPQGELQCLSKTFISLWPCPWRCIFWNMFWPIMIWILNQKC
jgi:hypothetical protein